MSSDDIVFNEDNLREAIVSVWGEHGAHVDLFDFMLKVIGSSGDEIERLRAELGELVQPSAYATGLVLQRLTEGRVRIVPAAGEADDDQ